MHSEKPRLREIGSLTHADFGAMVQVPGHGRGVLWAAHHGAPDDGEPATRVIIRPERGGGSEATKGLPPETTIRLWSVRP